jgi:hypothetical protein
VKALFRGVPLVILALLALCGCTHHETRSASAGPVTPTASSPPPAAETPLPAPVHVCIIDDDGGPMRAATATPSRAGTYDPHAPIDPALLNWTVEGVGCVSAPVGLPREASCLPDGGAVPVVHRQRCGQ